MHTNHQHVAIVSTPCAGFSAHEAPENVWHDPLWECSQDLPAM